MATHTGTPLELVSLAPLLADAIGRLHVGQPLAAA
jgi:hypothetical protein